MGGILATGKKGSLYKNKIFNFFFLSWENVCRQSNAVELCGEEGERDGVGREGAWGSWMWEARMPGSNRG